MHEQELTTSCMRQFRCFGDCYVVDFVLFWCICAGHLCNHHVCPVERTSQEEVYGGVAAVIVSDMQQP